MNAAPAYATIRCDRNERLEIFATIDTTKPLTIQDLHAALVDSLGRTPILWIKSENVTLLDFELYGNEATVDQKDCAPLVTIEAGSFRFERGWFVNSSKDGVEIDTVRGGGEIVGGVVQDVVSISGSGRADGLEVRNVFVENSDRVLIDGLALSDGEFDTGVIYRISENASFAHLRILNVSAPRARAGIVLENTSKKGSPSDYIINGNVAVILDEIGGSRGIVLGNIVPED